jgi:glycerol-3-phosphate acyltransferase PlsY
VDALLIAKPLIGFIVGYLLGSIPFGVVLTRAGGAGDLRTIGSGNIGATNVLRTGRKGLAAATLVLDGLKATAAILLVDAFIPDIRALAALGALLGHLFPVWLRFKGGKGVATLFGIVIGYCILDEISWVAALTYALVWIGLLLTLRISSVAGMAAALAMPVAMALLGRFDLALLFLGMALLVVWKHRENIGRLVAGTEPRIGRSRNG